MYLKDKTAIVTGAARGIGRAICFELAKKGANIVAVDVLKDPLEETVADLEKQNIKAVGKIVDVTDADAIAKLGEETVETFGGIYAMINNAGITRDGLLLSMDADQWDKVINVNLRGVFLGTQMAAKVMLRAREGRIINMASVSGVMGNAGQANYSASKAGVIGLTKTTAKELGKRGITCNAVAPGFITSDMTDILSDKVKEVAQTLIPLRRFGEVAEVAGVVGFLASPEASYVSGQVIQVDGGLRM